MTRRPFTCFDLIQDENSLAENIFLVLHIIRYVIYILLSFLKSYPILHASETIFTFGTTCRTHFKLIEMKILKNVLKSTLRGEKKQNKMQTSYKNQVT